MEHIETVIIGAGSAGLAVSHELTAADLEHVVLEQGKLGQTWRGRWDSFCLVTPNWTVQLPEGHYDGGDPDGFMPRDEIVGLLERYAAGFRAPIREGVRVTALERGDDIGFHLRTSAGEINAKSIIVSTGSFQKPRRPAGADGLPNDLLQIDVEGYHNPAALPPGKVMVIGSGQSGCQLAEELHEAGRDVAVACGKTPWVPRRIHDKDLVTWLARTPFFDATLADLPSPRARLAPNPQATGHGGGHDLHFRTLQAMGVQLLGHFLGAEGRRATFAPDLAESVAFGDARYADICNLIRKTCADRGEAAPDLPAPPPFRADAPDSIDLAGFGTVIFTAGFHPDYTSWIQFPDAFDDLGFPIQRDGVSTIIPGLYFVGVPFLRKRKSTIFLGIGEDAVVVSRKIVEARTGRRRPIRRRTPPHSALGPPVWSPTLRPA